MSSIETRFGLDWAQQALRALTPSEAMALEQFFTRFPDAGLPNTGDSYIDGLIAKVNRVATQAWTPLNQQQAASQIPPPIKSTYQPPPPATGATALTQGRVAGSSSYTPPTTTGVSTLGRDMRPQATGSEQLMGVPLATIATATPPPSTTAPPVKPLTIPNLQRNQVAINSALNKLAQADVLLQKAANIGLQVGQIQQQVAELRQLLTDARNHLLTP